MIALLDLPTHSFMTEALTWALKASKCLMLSRNLEWSTLFDGKPGPLDGSKSLLQAFSEPANVSFPASRAHQLLLGLVKIWFRV